VLICQHLFYSAKPIGGRVSTADSIRDAAKGAGQSDGVKALARLGFAARATIYLLIGWFAVLLAAGKHVPEADQRGALQEIARHTGGFVLLFVLAVGLAGYALWRFTEAAFGVVGQGKKAGPRLQSFARGCVYAFFAVNAFNLLATARASSQARQQQLLTAKAMAHPAGRWAVGIAGVVIMIIGLVLVVEGVKRTFKKYFKLGDMPASSRRLVWILGTVGTTARGIVFFLAGFFVLRAAWTYNASQARGLDGALRTLADSDHGRVWVGLVAIGMVAFGLYGYCEAAWRRT
jgi:hypothetical protein